MSDTLILVHTGISILIIVGLILGTKMHEVLAITIGALYLGIATGLGFANTAQTVSAGFGGIMADIGLLIVFGVLLGSLLSAVGALERLTSALLRVFGAERSPYVFGMSMSSVFPAIYTDVLLVLTAPLGNRIAPRIRNNGTASMGAALVLGSELGLVLVVPGAGALAVAGLLDVSLSQMLLWGLVVALPTAFFSILVYRWLLKVGLWNAEKDEITAVPANGPEETPERSSLPLPLLLLPLLISVALIALGGIAKAAGLEDGVISFLGNPMVALLLGLLLAYFLAWRSLGNDVVNAALDKALRNGGPILVITGLGGALGAVISESGLESILAGYFSANALSPLLLAWLIAVILHAAIGSTSVAAITAAGILAPVMGQIGVDPLLIALAAGSGALFALHVNSNFFWMTQKLLNLSTQGTLKVCTIITSIASVISLFCVLALSLFL
ncbi:MAG TPA: SLC13 family permease [Arthrobacter sp.]|nr:SLC13 family permease [Arthrobacter sp.]